MKAYAEESTMGWYSEINSYNFSNPKLNASTGYFTQVIFLNKIDIEKLNHSIFFTVGLEIY
jgi:hypothetical protein